MNKFTHHQMRLDPLYFEEIRSGRKRIEIRLNDFKRQKIRIGDKIKFLDRSNEKNSLNVEVVGKNIFPDLISLFDFYALGEFGNVWNCSEEAVNAVTYYSKSDIEKYGLLALEVHL